MESAGRDGEAPRAHQMHDKRRTRSSCYRCRANEARSGDPWRGCYRPTPQIRPLCCQVRIGIQSIEPLVRRLHGHADPTQPSLETMMRAPIFVFLPMTILAAGCTLDGTATRQCAAEGKELGADGTSCVARSTPIADACDQGK